MQKKILQKPVRLRTQGDIEFLVNKTKRLPFF